MGEIVPGNGKYGPAGLLASERALSYVLLFACVAVVLTCGFLVWRDLEPPAQDPQDNGQNVTLELDLRHARTPSPVVEASPSATSVPEVGTAPSAAPQVALATPAAAPAPTSAPVSLPATGGSPAPGPAPSTQAAAPAGPASPAAASPVAGPAAPVGAPVSTVPSPGAPAPSRASAAAVAPPGGAKAAPASTPATGPAVAASPAAKPAPGVKTAGASKPATGAKAATTAKNAKAGKAGKTAKAAKGPTRTGAPRVATALDRPRRTAPPVDMLRVPEVPMPGGGAPPPWSPSAPTQGTVTTIPVTPPEPASPQREGHDPFLPAVVTIVGHLVHPVQDNGTGVVNDHVVLVNLLTFQSVRGNLANDGSFTFTNLHPRGRYCLSAWHHRRSSAGVGPAAPGGTFEAKLSWHQAITAPRGGTYALYLSPQNADPFYCVDQLLPNDLPGRQSTLRPAELQPISQQGYR